MTPGARGVGEDQRRDRLAHRDRRDRDHPPPAAAPASPGPRPCTSRSSRGSSARTPGRRRRGRRCSRSHRPAAHRRWRTRMSMPPERLGGRVDEPGRTFDGADVGDERDAAVADPGRRLLDPGLVATADRDLHPFARERGAVANPRPRDAAATAARRPSIPRFICGSFVARFTAWIGPVPSRSDATPGPAGAHRDDLGADRDRGLLRGPRADVEPDRRHHAGQPGVVDPGFAQPLDPRRVGPPRSHRPEVAHVGLRAPRRSPGRRTSRRGSARTRRRVARESRRPSPGSDPASRSRSRRPSGTAATVANTARASHTVTR